jgi:hypothetical protein
MKNMEESETKGNDKNAPSIRILIKRICIAFNGLSSPIIVLTVISVKAAAAVLNWNERKFWMLWNIDLPVVRT